MKKLCLLIGLALALTASAACADLLFSDDFSGTGVVNGQNGWVLSGTGNAGPQMVSGEAKWVQDSSGGGQRLAQSFEAQSTGILNVYFDMKFNYFQPTYDAGTNMNIIKLYSSSGSEVWRLRCWSGQYPEGVQTTNVDDIKHNSAVIGQFAPMETMSVWASWNLDAKTYSLYINGTQVIANDTSYWGTSWANIGKFEWESYNYVGAQGFTTAESYMDNVAIYLNEERPAVPEPSSFMALGMFGLGAFGYIKRRRA